MSFHFKQKFVHKFQFHEEGVFQQSTCKEKKCVTIHRYWTRPSEITFVNGTTPQPLTFVSPTAFYPHSICLQRQYTKALSQLFYDISAGNGHFLLGRMHIKSYTECEAVTCSMHVMYSQLVISSSVRSVRWGELHYNGSYIMDYEVPSALFIRMQITVLNPFDVYFQHSFEKIEECKYHTDIRHISEISLQCEQIYIPYHIGHALLLTKREHHVTMSVHPHCNIKNRGLHLDMIIYEKASRVKYDLVWQDAIVINKPLELPQASGFLNISWNTFPHNHKISAQCSIVITFLLKNKKSLFTVHDVFFKKVPFANGFQIKTNLGYDEIVLHDM